MSRDDNFTSCCGNVVCNCYITERLEEAIKVLDDLEKRLDTTWQPNPSMDGHVNHTLAVRARHLVKEALG